MWELLNNAWNGWGNFIFYGKYPALLLLVLVVFWFFSDKKREPVLLGYTTVVTVCCICPLTAALLMVYQTRFYDYQWVWSYVPLTMVIAFAGTLLLGHCREAVIKTVADASRKGGLVRNCKVPAAALVMLVVILLCGRLTDPLADAKTDWQTSVSARATVETITEIMADTDAGDTSGVNESAIMLWAPKEVMAAARIYCPDIQLPYGRDLWDASLGAYTYDTYTEVEEDLCQWMHCTGVFGTVDGYRLDGTVLEGANCVEQALKLGVKCIVVPDVMTTEAITDMTMLLEEALWGQPENAEQAGNITVHVQQLEKYYIFTWN